MNKWMKVLIAVSIFSLLLNLLGVKLIYDLHNENNELEQEYNNQSIKNDSLEKELNETLSKVDKLTKANNNLSDTLAELEELKKERDSLIEKQEELVMENIEYENKINELENKLYGSSSHQSTSNDYTPVDGKVAYLTFDDGPSSNTNEILDILKEYNVKATFFVLGTNIGNKSIMQRIVDEGHTVANHTYSHDYSYIYDNEENFWKDFLKSEEKIYNTTGVRTKIMRFPGGSNNKVHEKYADDPNFMNRLKQSLTNKGYIYHDWNNSSGDASGNNVSKDTLVSNVLNTKSKKVINVLMHDSGSKDTTVEALPEIIEGLQQQGYSFKPITESTKPIQFK